MSNNITSGSVKVQGESISGSVQKVTSESITNNGNNFTVPTSGTNNET